MWPVSNGPGVTSVSWISVQATQRRHCYTTVRIQSRIHAYTCTRCIGQRVFALCEYPSATYLLAISARVLAKIVERLDQTAQVAAQLSTGTCRVFLACHAAVGRVDMAFVSGQVGEIFLLSVGEFRKIPPFPVDFAAESRIMISKDFVWGRAAAGKGCACTVLEQQRPCESWTGSS